MGAMQPPPAATTGFLWFLRLVALMALPLWALSAEVGTGAELGILALVGACALVAFVIARRVHAGAFQFTLIGVICALEGLLILYAIAR